MRIMLRAFPILLLMGLCTVTLAQSNNSSGTNLMTPDAVVGISNSNSGGSSGSTSTTGQQPYEIQMTPGQSSQQGVSIASEAQTSGTNGHQLSQEEIDRISNSIMLFQNQLQQINDPNDPRAIKLQTTIDELQDIINNQ